MSIVFKQTAISTKAHYHEKGKPCRFCEKRCPICNTDFNIPGSNPFKVKGRSVFCAQCGVRMPHLEAEIIPVIDGIDITKSNGGIIEC